MLRKYGFQFRMQGSTFWPVGHYLFPSQGPLEVALVGRKGGKGESSKREREIFSSALGVLIEKEQKAILILEGV